MAEEIEMQGDDERTYLVSVRCTNCGRKWREQIPRGTTTERWLDTILCPTCGCGTIVKRRSWA